ncbi:MAG TPA: efflux RND transporter permease subunit [Nevskia sp.]|nr:efflux RND transporter permease subunit [Nevskia sp.]
MWITKTSINQPVFATMVMVALLVLGVSSYLRLPVEQMPDVSNPTVSLQIEYPGGSPEALENDVVKPIENQINSVDGVKRIYATMREGVAYIQIEFRLDVNVDTATQEVRDKIAQIRPTFPRDVKDPLVTRANNDANQQPIINLDVYSDTRSLREVSTLTEQVIIKRLQNAPGVGNIQAIGETVRQVQVHLKPAQLDAYRISVNQVIQAIQDANQDLPAGSIIHGPKETQVRLTGRMKTPAEFGRIIVAMQGGAVYLQQAGIPVYLDQVADVVDGDAEETSIARVNGKRSVALLIFKVQNANIVQVGDGVREALAELKKRLPDDVHIETMYSNADGIKAQLSGVKQTILEGALLTIAIVFLFLHSWRSTIITGLTLPISVITTFIVLKVFGFTLNFITLMALSLCIGLLIDDAIVVRENIVRHLHMGKSHLQAARDGTEEIGLAVMATTFAILAVFVPVAFMAGIIGRYFFQFGITVAVAVLVSLFVSFTLDPMLSSVWRDPPATRFKWMPWLERLLNRVEQGVEWLHRVYGRVLAWGLNERRRGVFIPWLGCLWLVLAFALSSLGLGMGGALARVVRGARWFPGPGEPFWRSLIPVFLRGLLFAPAMHPPVFGIVHAVRSLNWRQLGTISNRGIVLWVAGATFIGSFGLAGMVGTEFIPQTDDSYITLRLNTAIGSSLEYTNAKAHQVEEVLKAFPEITAIETNVGTDEGKNYARINLRLSDPQVTHRRSQKELEKAIRARIASLAGITLSVGFDKPIFISILGPDASKLSEISQTLMKQMAKIPGIADLESSEKGDVPTISVRINGALASDLGLTNALIGNALRPLIAGSQISHWLGPDGQDYDVVVQLPKNERRLASDLGDLYLSGTRLNPDGTQMLVPLRQVANFVETTEAQQLKRLNLQRRVSLYANAEGRPSGDVGSDVEKLMAKMKLPPGYRFDNGGQQQDMNDAMQAALAALGLAVIFIYLILASQFGSFLQPVAIMASLPLSLSGVIIALLVTGTTLNLFSMIGFIMLMGLVTKNAILLVDFTNHGIRAGRPLREALLEAGQVRLRPIMMTTMAMIFGMLPMASGITKGGELLAPMGRAVIGGIITSTLLTLVVVPVLYTFVHAIGEKAKAWFGAGADEHRPDDTVAVK